ncbi:hypothetical protein POM88_053900 [Heracleum sosnowskyi]|uniref:SAM-dependent methyltransferase RsmB-F/NOP2-type catalytic core domain-containing protein n=1 Tax=Heracleum sosnowskyi TaxID=360622 RepID=A0AAD8GPL3_9APIA|nr:hypothetical protein POM88_053900 [Heracleum sosnowskyi]
MLSRVWRRRLATDSMGYALSRLEIDSECSDSDASNSGIDENSSPNEPMNILDHDVAQLTKLRSAPHENSGDVFPGKRRSSVNTVKMLAGRECNYSGRGRFSAADRCHLRFSQVVGWPPVRAYRINSLNQAKLSMTEDFSSIVDKSENVLENKDNKCDWTKGLLTQLLLLTNGFKLLKVGGYLVYSTFSLTVAQNEDVVEQFLLQNSSASSLEIELEAKTIVLLLQAKMMKMQPRSLSRLPLSCFSISSSSMDRVLKLWLSFVVIFILYSIFCFLVLCGNYGG